MEADRTTVAVIPALNEADEIGSVVSRVKKHVDQILVIDGHSSDGTQDVATEAGAHVVAQTGNGKGGALREAFTLAKGDIVVFIDADGSMSPEEIPNLVRTIEENPDVDLVKASRFLPGGYSEDISLIRRIGNSFFIFMVNLLWSADYTDICYGLGAFRKEALKKLLPHLKSDRFEIETEICIKAKKLGLKVMEVPSVELRRTNGKSRLHTLHDGTRILKTILLEAIKFE